MPKIAEVKLSSCGLEVANFRKSCGCGIAELRLRSNISLKSCGNAIAEVLPSSCGIAIADSKKSCSCPPLVSGSHGGQKRQGKATLPMESNAKRIRILTGGTSRLTSPTGPVSSHSGQENLTDTGLKLGNLTAMTNMAGVTLTRTEAAAVAGGRRADYANPGQIGNTPEATENLCSLFFPSVIMYLQFLLFISYAS